MYSDLEIMNRVARYSGLKSDRGLTGVANQSPVEGASNLQLWLHKQRSSRPRPGLKMGPNINVNSHTRRSLYEEHRHTIIEQNGASSRSERRLKVWPVDSGGCNQSPAKGVADCAVHSSEFNGQFHHLGGAEKSPEGRGSTPVLLGI